MKLKTILVSDWPKLAWIANFVRGTNCIHVLHGPRVEIDDDWCVEAVWTGDFTAGDFDKTELVFGTGVRVRDHRVFFVNAGTMLDRLYYCEHEGQFFVSNTLPGLLARAEISLFDDYPHYPDDIMTMREGLSNFKRKIPADLTDMQITYYNNLVYDGSGIKEISKPDLSPDFNCYTDYHEFLIDTAACLGQNMCDPGRKHSIEPLSTVSSGYDSGAAATIAREAGCTSAVTISNASSLFPRCDSGAEIAKCLGMECTTYHHNPKAYKHEASVWSIAGRPAGLNLTIFDFPEPLCLFFTGYRGDSIWCRAILNNSDPFWTFSIDGLSLCEFRLIQGLFHCVVPSWGGQKGDQIRQISFHKDMEPWTLHRDYDRPIPRRIMEEAGVPRKLFGNRKEVTSAQGFLPWPLTREGRTSFGSYLKDRRFYAPSYPYIWALRKIVHLDKLIYVNITHKFGWHNKGLRFVLKLKGQSLLFQWGNHMLKEMYRKALP
ncbi:MAG: hypothetical protein KAV87_19440 [Desulfobacteraceae bacterium]|nr:hypothetical protein [Desulfobacteraceae bacterium]